MTYELHPLCTLFPRMAGTEFKALCDDLAVNGLRTPITLHNGMILDGGNRYRACLEAGIDPVFQEFNGSSLVQFVLSANLHRRHLSAGQQAAIVASAQDWANAQTRGGDRKTDQSATLHFDTADKRAAESGASLRTQKMADKVAKADPALSRQVAHGEVSLPKAVAQVDKQAGKAAKPNIAAAKTEAEQNAIDAFGGTDTAELLQEMQNDLRRAEAQTAEFEKAMKCNDTHAELARVLRLLDHAERQKNDAMADAVSIKRTRDYYEKQLARCGKAVGMADLDKIAAAVETFVRSHKVTA